MKSFISFLLLVLLFTITFSTDVFSNDYFPNRNDDVFTYTSDFSTGSLTDSVISTYFSYWKLHASFGGFGEMWVYTHPENQDLYVYSNSQFYKIANFSDPVGTEYNIIIDPCNRGTSKIGAKNLTVTVAAGTFNNVIRVDYFDLNCNDAGIISQYYAKDIGLIKFDYITIAGPHYYEFKSGRVNGVDYPVKLKNGIKIRGYTDRYIYVADLEPPGGPDRKPPEVYIELTVTNNTRNDIPVLYNSSCKYNILVKDLEGNTVYCYLNHVMCAHVMVKTILKSGESITSGNFVPLENEKTGKVLPPGDYTVEIITTGSVSWSMSFPIKFLYAL